MIVAVLVGGPLMALSGWVTFHLVKNFFRHVPKDKRDDD